MNAKLKLMCSFIMVAVLANPLCADFFENLDFEDVIVDGSIELTAWETNAEFLNYNQLCLGSVCTSIHDDESEFFQPLQGTYSIHLDAGSNIGDFDYIWQTGTVPTFATSLTILVDIPDPDSFLATFDGTPLTILSQSPSQWSFDISTFAGATGELRFGTLAIMGFNEGALIDDIQFVPEPSSFLWLAMGCLFVIGTERRKLRNAKSMSKARTGKGSGVF